MYPEPLTGAASYRPGSERILVVGGQTSLGKMVGSSLVKLPHVDGTVYTANDKPWSLKQYKGVIYGARPQCGVMQRIDELKVMDSGIGAASAGPTVVEGAAGSLPAGTYQCVVTGYNPDTGTESNPSPVGEITIGASKRINWSDIPIFANPQVSARRLYRSLVGATDQYFFIDQINDNATTTYIDDIVEEQMISECSLSNGLPPPTCNAIEIWQERMWSTDGTYLYMSELGLPECYDVGYETWSISPDDGHDMVGLLDFGDRLLVGKTNMIAYMTTIDGVRYRVSELTHDHGVYSHASFIKTETVALWFGGDNFYMTDGTVVRAIGDIKIRTLVDSIDPADFDLIYGAVDTTLGLFFGTIPTLGKVAIYNYRNDTWSQFDYFGGTDVPEFIIPYFDTLGQRMLYCSMVSTDGGKSIYMIDPDATDDNGTPIICEAITKYFGHEEEAGEVILNDFEVNCTPSTDLLTVTGMADEGYEYSPSTTLEIIGDRRNWFRPSLATNTRPANTVAVKLEYSGRDAVDILGFTMEVAYLERRVPVSG